MTRSGAGVAYDAGRGVLVMFGGATNETDRRTTLDDTWTWDGRTWRRHPTSPLPPEPGSADMAYDLASRAVLLYAAPAGGDHQTWRWDGATWTEVHPRTTPDVVRGAMAFDGRRLLLFDTTAPLSQRYLLWQEPGTWSPKVVAGMPQIEYFLSASGLTEAEFFRVADSLQPVG